MLPYYNPDDTDQPYAGPNNSGDPNNTVRSELVALQLKAGAPANAGHQATPAVDDGWFGLYVITVNYAQTTVTAGSIATYTNAPFLAAYLQSHHGGVPGQAPKVNLASEVQGTLPYANMAPVRSILTGPLALYVAVNGNDANNGLTTGTAFATSESLEYRDGVV